MTHAAPLSASDSGDAPDPVPASPTPTTTEPAAPTGPPTADQRIALIYQGPGLVPGIPVRNLTVADLWILVGDQARADRISGEGRPYRRTVAYPTTLPIRPPRQG